MIDDARTQPLPPAAHRPVGCCGLVLAVTLLATGCTLPRAASSTPREAEIPAEVVWERDLPVVGGVVTTEHVAVTYLADDDGTLTLVALSTADGRTLWQHEAGRGAVRPSLSEIVPVVFDRDDQTLVAYLDPDPPRSSTSLARNRLVVADLETGEEIGHTEPLYFYSSPERCADRASVCVWASHAHGAGRAFLDLETGELRTHPYQFQDHAAGTGIQHVEDSRAWELVRFTDDGTTWTREVADLPGGSEDADIIAAIPGGDVDWMAVMLRDTSESGTDAGNAALEEETMLLLDAGSGEVIWSDQGYPLDCPSDYLNAGVRCAASGTQHSTDAGPDSYSDLDLTLEGFDADGTTTWTLPLGDDPGPLTGGGPSVPGDWLVLTTAEGAELLDPDRGRTMPVPAGWTFLCSETAAIGNSVHWDVDEPDEDTWSGGPLYTTCRAAGTPVDGPPSVAAVRAVGAETGAVTLVAHPGRLVAYAVTDDEDDAPASPSPEPADDPRG